MRRALDQAREVRDQLSRADVIVINKTDLLTNPKAESEALVALVQHYNPLAQIFFSARGEGLPWSLLLNQNRPSTIETPPTEYHHHASFETWSYATEALLDDRRLEEFIYDVPMNVFRLKGLVRTNAEWPWTLVHSVAGAIDIRPFTPSKPPKQAGLVFIGKDLDRRALLAACESLLV